jgi:predicted glycosyltransferase
MKVLIDIGHPGHVHYFRNLIKIMESEGHQFQIVARDKEVVFKLLDYFNIPYKSRGKGGKGVIGKLIYIFLADFRIYKIALKFKPDLFLSFSSTYAGHVAFLLNRPHVVFDDTEHAKFEHIMYKPFAESIITPSCFYKPMGKKQVFFDGYMEMCYLHVNYFKPNPYVLRLLQVKENEKFVIIRFVSFEAGHDIGHHGLDYKAKIILIEEIQKHVKVIISSESYLPKEIEKFKINIPPEMLHDALAYSALYIGEGGTTASEAAILGIPAIYINSLPLMGYLQDEEKAGLLFHLNDPKHILSKALQIIKDPYSSEKFKLMNAELLKSKIDVTAFMIWLIETYPESTKIIRENPNYQFRFK